MRIGLESSAALIIDIQEKLYPHIFDHDNLLENVKKLISGLKALGVPILLTEQYSKGLGETIRPVADLLPGSDPVEKISFSCCDESQVMANLRKLNRKFVIIAGIEAHVCVMQTVIDLVENGFKPVVVVDCVSSRNEKDKIAAVERMRSEGALPATCESILFEICRVAGTEKFKAVSAIIK